MPSAMALLNSEAAGDPADWPFFAGNNLEESSWFAILLLFH